MTLKLMTLKDLEAEYRAVLRSIDYAYTSSARRDVRRTLAVRAICRRAVVLRALIEEHRSD